MPVIEKTIREVRIINLNLSTSLTNIFGCDINNLVISTWFLPQALFRGFFREN